MGTTRGDTGDRGGGYTGESVDGVEIGGWLLEEGES